MPGNAPPAVPAWAPPSPPPRGKSDPAARNAFHAHILTPGFSMAFHAATLNRSLTTIATYRVNALRAAEANPAIMTMVCDNVLAIGPEQGLAMAQARGKAQLPHWSRMAIRDYRKRGWPIQKIAEAFQCSLGTVTNVLRGRGQGYTPLSGKRRLTASQKAPVGRWGHQKFA